MLHEYWEKLKLSLLALDVFLSLLAYGAAFFVRFFLLDLDLSDLLRIEWRDYFFLGIVLVVFQGMILVLIKLYTLHRFLSPSLMNVRIASGVCLNIVVAFTILYISRINDIARLLPLFYGVFAFIFMMMGHSFFRSRIKKKMLPKDMRNSIIIGEGALAQKIASIFENNKLFSVNILGFIQEEPFCGQPTKNLLGKVDDLTNLIEQYKPYSIIYAGRRVYRENLQKILNTCDQHGVHLQIVPEYGELIAHNGLIEYCDGLPVISFRKIPSRQILNRIIKRAFDLICALLFLYSFIPLFLVIMFFIKISSRGPLFFFQERIGLDSRLFRIIKFRTMHVQEPSMSKTVWTIKDDPRVTRFGKLLRRTSLDELPQFFNVLVGHMSIVGPRPERPYYVERFKTHYNSFKRRHTVKSGLTGLAQIHDLRGDTPIQARIDADLSYIENWSLGLDLKIIFLTPLNLFSKNAY